MSDAIIADKVIEVKDVKKIYATRQLKAIAGWAKKTGPKAILIVSENNEYIAKTVRKLGFEIERR